MSLRVDDISHVDHGRFLMCNVSYLHDTLFLTYTFCRISFMKS